jgi:hypothetical protein
VHERDAPTAQERDAQRRRLAERASFVQDLLISSLLVPKSDY